MNETKTVPAAYLGVILIWTTTPLAIKWSGQGTNFLFALTARMAIGAAICLLLLALRRRRFPLHRAALNTYLAAGLGIYGSMGLVYWGAQHIPSGWVSVLFGLNPILTGVLAGFLLNEGRLTPAKLLGSGLGLLGLTAIFGGGLTLGAHSMQGIAAVVAATTLHCLSAIWVKRIAAGIPALDVTAGGVSLSVLLLGLTWWGLGIGWPAEIPLRSGFSILYLGVFGSVIGFVLYYYVLKHVEATRVALITLITPVSALLLGRLLNGEALSLSVAWGTTLILLGLLCFEFGGRVLPVLARGRTGVS